MQSRVQRCTESKNLMKRKSLIGPISQFNAHLNINVSEDFSSAKITKSFTISFQILTKTTGRKIS